MNLKNRLDKLAATRPGGRVLLKAFDEPIRDRDGNEVRPEDLRAGDTVVRVSYADEPAPDWWKP
ncbi:MAG TPA: hypothetical protein VHN99_11070 [Deinococcales bacterium]|nr:hypothetical protein [Deinococcales bacterium]